MPAVLGVSLKQDPKVLAKAEGKTVYLPCTATELSSSDYIHWYQIKDGEAPLRLLYISKDGAVTPDNNAENAFTVDKRKLYDLKLSKTKKSHSAVYFCAYWDSSNRKVFGSGTRLYVTDSGKDKIVPPTLSAYLPTIKRSGKQTMLCQATGMFPDLVKFTWKKKSSTVDWTAVPEDKVVEQRNDDPKVIVTSMMIVDENTAGDDQYECTVTHEGSTEKPISKPLQKVSKDSNKPTDATLDSACPTASTEETEKKQISGTSEQMAGLYLFLYAYGVMLMKNGVYFCAVSIFLLKRKFGKKEESA